MGVNLQKYSLRLIKEDGSRYDLEDKVVQTPDDAVQIFNQVLSLSNRSEEVCAMLTLDVKNQVTGVFEVSIGNLSSSLVTPREVFKRAILHNAQGVILAHNHPSGRVEPSADDITLTQKLSEGGKLLGIQVLDHLVLGIDDFVSMKQKNMFS